MHHMDKNSPALLRELYRQCADPLNDSLLAAEALLASPALAEDPALSELASLIRGQLLRTASALENAARCALPREPGCLLLLPALEALRPRAEAAFAARGFALTMEYPDDGAPILPLRTSDWDLLFWTLADRACETALPGSRITFSVETAAESLTLAFSGTCAAEMSGDAEENGDVLSRQACLALLEAVGGRMEVRHSDPDGFSLALIFPPQMHLQSPSTAPEVVSGLDHSELFLMK